MMLKEIDNLKDVPEIEKLKLKLDYEKIRIDRNKMWATVTSIFIPLIIGAGTIGYGIWSESQQANSSFEIKAVEIVMNASSPIAATNKAIVLYELFPDRLPKDFKRKMLSMYGNPEQKPELK